MTRISSRIFPTSKAALKSATVLVGATAALAGCATPNYPVGTSGASATPAPAAVSTAPPTPAPAPAPVDTAPAITTPPQAGPVQSEPLPPPTGEAAPQSSSPPSEPQTQAQSASPAFTPPTYAPPPSTPAYATSAPPRFAQPQAAYTRRERVVAGGQVVAATHMYRDYVVQKGDHLDAIARDFQADPKTLAETNHLSTPNAIRPGQHLKIPVEKAYVVQSGDTMAAVAQRFGVPAEELASLNDISVRDRLRSGDRLALPSDIHDRGPTRVNETVVAQATPRFVPPRAAPPANDYLPRSGVYSPGSADQAVNSTPPGNAASAPATSYAYAPRPSSRYPAYTHNDGRYAGIVGAPSSGASLNDSQIAAAGKGRFVWPVRGETLAKFGEQGVGRRNDGLDIKSPEGSPVRAAAAGEVVYAGNQVPGFGNLVLVKHADGWVTAYAHLDRASVSMRQTVAQGQEIGIVGMTGGVPEPQLHFEVRYAAAPTDKAKPIDPMLVLPE